ncbi:SurA N-terminal domain-containing protein [Virgibacillus oceani]
MKKKWLLSLSLSLLVFVIAACGNDEDNSAEDNNEGSEEAQEETTEDGGQAPEAGTEQAEMPEPDLENIPDVVAEVNGEEITKDEFETTYVGQFQQAMMQAQMSGQEVDQDQLKGQIAEALIGQELIIQEAENKGFEASEEDVDETLAELVEQNGLNSQDDFFAALEEEGLTEDEVRSDLETQVKIEALIASESGDMEPTEEELEELYEAYTASMEQQQGDEAEIPSFEEMEPQLTQELVGQKETEVYQTLVEQLQAEADITNNLS